jgi:hypothetical protein
MTRDDIIRMARAADNDDLFDAMQVEFLERFATLAADAEAKRMHDEGMVTVGHMREQIAAAREAATEEANARQNASWARMCKKMVAAEREAMVAEAAKRGWAMKNEDSFEDAVREIANDRARSKP